MEMVLGCWVKGQLTHMTSAEITQLDRAGITVQSQENIPQPSVFPDRH